VLSKFYELLRLPCYYYYQIASALLSYSRNTLFVVNLTIKIVGSSDFEGLSLDQFLQQLLSESSFLFPRSRYWALVKVLKNNFIFYTQKLKNKV
jgi:hypothetical protein